MANRVFFPQPAVDQWAIDGAIDLTASELIVLAEARRYKVTEAVHVVSEVTGANDEHELVGKVKARSALDELGAEILEGSMILGDNAYDVVAGWVGEPSTPWAEHLASPERDKARGGKQGSPSSDEELLASFARGEL